jgi:hypothetical protein
MQALAAHQDWAGYVRDPAWIPHFYDPRRDTLVLARLPREAQRKLTFLDQRFVDRDAESLPAPISQLPLDLVSQNAGPLHFVFHTGFCCSTLLARVLCRVLVEQPPHCRCARSVDGDARPLVAATDAGRNADRKTQHRRQSHHSAAPACAARREGDRAAFEPRHVLARRRTAWT